MRPWGLLAVASIVFPGFGWARQDPAICGTHSLKLKEEMFLHRQAVRKRTAARAAAVPRAASATQDTGNIAVLDSGNGALVARNQFDLDRRTLSFLPATPAAATYKFQLGEASYDAAAATGGSPLNLGDDDTTPVNLPFSFPFYGIPYRQVYVNSDGNLTFTMGDSASAERSLGRLGGGPPRIAPLFTDLDPSQAGSNGSVSVLAEPGRFIVSWSRVPQFTDTGVAPRETFQVRLYPDGHIEYAYNGISVDSAVVGIGPGSLRAASTLVSFLGDPSSTYAGLVAERFSNTVDLDLNAAAQQFYQTHDDAYDYLVFYNNMGIQASAGAVSWETTVRNNRTGYGDTTVDTGAQFGSPSRLQAILNMGYLAQFPVDPTAGVPARGPTGDTPITILAHEAGHLFLAYASIRDPGDPAARPMLGSQEAHWGFNFNSDASLLEGNRIQDGSPASVPEFTTVGTVEGYSPLDQYLMGFLPPDQVEPGYPFGVYLVTGVPASLHTRLPQVGVSFNGTRRDVHMDELIQAEGRRTPDSTVAQRRFRFAIILLVAANTPPPAAELAQLETYRTTFEGYYQQASGNHAFADTALRHSLHISAFPAAGTMTGATTPVTLSVDTPPAAPLSVALAAPNGMASVPTSVTIAAGARSASFNMAGIRAGVEELSATPDDSRYDAAYARIQVSPAAALQLNAIPGAGPMPQPVTAQVTDINRLPYPGVSLQATASAGGSVTPAVAVTDAAGNASFRWNPGTGSNQQLRIAVANAPDVAAVLGPVQAAAVLNAASLAEAAAPGMLAAIYGFNLGAAGTELTLDGRALQVVDVEDARIRFHIPPDTPLGTSTLTISNALGRAPPVAVPITAVAPGIFYDYGTGFALGLTQPVAAGSVIQIFCTGLGTQPDQVQAAIGGVPGAVQYSGAAPGMVGVNQVNAQVPTVASGTQPLSLTIGGVTSNEVRIGVQ